MKNVKGRECFASTERPEIEYLSKVFQKLKEWRIKSEISNFFLFEYFQNFVNIH